MELHFKGSFRNNKYNDNNNNNNNNDNDINDYNNNLYLKRVTQSNGKDLPWGPLACLQVAQGPQGYKVVCALLLGIETWRKVVMVHIWLLRLSHSKLWALSMKCIFGQLIYYILEELIVRRLHFEYHSCGFLVYMRKVCSYNGGLTHWDFSIQWQPVGIPHI